MTKLASEYIVVESVLNTSGRLNYSSFKQVNELWQTSKVNENDAYAILKKKKKKR